MSRVDITKTYVLPNGQGPAIIRVPLNLPDEGDYAVEGWLSNFGASNVYLMAGDVPLAEAQAQLTDPADAIDCLMVLTGAGRTMAAIDRFTTRSLTLFFEALNNSGQAQGVTLRVRDR